MPDWRADIRARLGSVSLAPAREADIVEELAQHLEDRWRDLVASGDDPAEAERLTRAEWRDGNLLARYLAPLRQAHWSDPAPVQPRRWYAFGGLTTDLRDAVRSLRSAPSFTAVALIVLTLGMGATTAIFSVVDAVVLRPLPFDAPDELVAVGERRPARVSLASAPIPVDPLALHYVQPQNYLDWVTQQQVFTGIAAIADADVTYLPDGGEPEALTARRVTANFFDILRIRPATGRAFTAETEVEGRHRVAVLSDAFWRRRFGADPSLIGRPIRLDDGVYEVIGVLGPGVLAPDVTYPVGTGGLPDLWVPYVMPANERVRGRGHSMYLQCVARLKPGVSMAQAQAGMDQVAAGIERAHPEWNRGFTIGVRPLRDHHVGASVQSWMLMLLTAAGIVLLIACTNVANLLLARATAREHEVGIRAALGAGRWRLVRQFVVESVVLSLAGAAMAAIVASGLLSLLRSAMPVEVPRVATIGLDLRVLAAAVAASLVTGALFGLLPAVQVSKPTLTRALRAGARSAGAGKGRQHLRRALVVAEVALSVMLLVGAALFIGSFIRVMRVEAGFTPQGVLTARLDVRRVPGAPPRSVPFDQIVEQLSQREGVVGAAAVSPGIPMVGRSWLDAMNLPGRPPDRIGVSIKVVTPEYHRVLSIPLKAGRYFEVSDRSAGPYAIVLSGAAAKAYFPGENPIGRVVWVNGTDRTIVGVVGDVRQGRLEAAPEPEVYLPMSQVAPRSSSYLVTRAAGDPDDVLPAMKATTASLAPNLPLREIASMDELIARQTSQRRLNMLMLGLFGVLGLVISAVGVYGVMAFLVAQRTREIGVRMALGATRPQVIWMVLRSGGAMLAVGLATGAIGAWYLAATARQFLFQLEAHDPRAFVVAVLVLSLACVAATIVPARRAASVDPTVALRSE